MFVQNKNLEIIPVTDFNNFDFDRDSLIAIQDEGSYMRLSDRKSYVRILKGRMNMYYLYTHYTTTSFHGPSSANPSGISHDTRTKITRYFDLGLDQPLVLFDRQNMGIYTKECVSCLDVLHSYDNSRKALKWWKYGNWAAIGGALVWIFTGDQNVSDDSDLRIYGNTGLFFGGLTSEIYRLTRVKKVEIKLEKVVETYNNLKY